MGLDLFHIRFLADPQKTPFQEAIVHLNYMSDQVGTFLATLYRGCWRNEPDERETEFFVASYEVTRCAAERLEDIYDVLLPWIKSGGMDEISTRINKSAIKDTLLDCRDIISEIIKNQGFIAAGETKGLWIHSVEENHDELKDKIKRLESIGKEDVTAILEEDEGQNVREFENENRPLKGKSDEFKLSPKDQATLSKIVKTVVAIKADWDNAPEGSPRKKHGYSGEEIKSLTTHGLSRAWRRAIKDVLEGAGIKVKKGRGPRPSS